jgi:nitroreductase
MLNVNSFQIKKWSRIMDVFEAITRRYSCRSFKPEPIESEKLSKILEAARLAPSARNLQDWRFVVVTDAEIKKQLSAAANNQKPLAQAGAVIVACSNSDHVMRCGQPIAPIDVAIALEHIALEATELGLATCWIGSFYPDKVKPILGIPEDIQIIELMTIGHAADTQPAQNRNPLDKIVSYEKWRF